jgi:LysR family transcriptional regulator, glycine cleavage system transcriptional activator
MIAEDKLRLTLPATSLPSRKALPPFEALRAFDAIARLGGVRKAAQYLCRDHAVVSRHLRTIEDWTGTKLIERTPGGAVLTEDGVRYHKQIAAAIDQIAGATVDLMKRGDTHRLHIRCMPGFALHWLSGRLGEFEQANPGVDIEVRPADRSPDLLAHHTDIDIRFVATYGVAFELPPELRDAEIVEAPVLAVASREYLAKTSPIKEPRDLLKQQLLHEENFDRWHNWLGVHGVHDDVELTGPRLWQGHLTLDAARYGRGVALASYLIAADDLAAGRLVEVGKGNDSFQPYATGIYHFIAKQDRWDSVLIRKFRQWLLAAVRKEYPQLKSPAEK